MLSWIILIVLLVLLSAAGIWAIMRYFGPAPLLDAAADADELRAENLAAVARGDLAALRFDVAAGGYRQDQVDEVLAALSALATQAGQPERGPRQADLG